MDQKRKYIKESVKSGEYFTTAKDFYASMYLHPIAARAQFLLLVIFLVIAAYIAVTAFIREYSDLKWPFPIYAVDQVKYYPRISHLAYKSEPVEFSICRYLSEHYLYLREVYNYQDFDPGTREKTFDLVRALSSQRVFREYMDYMDPEQNTDSPILIYKNRVKRAIEVESIEMKSVENQLVGAEIIFNANISGSNYDKVGKYKAYIEFYLNDIDSVVKKDEKLNFLITKYQTYKLSN